MNTYFPQIPKIKYEGAGSKNALAFKYYNSDRIINGKPMKDHLKFAMAWWHTLCASGADMFGSETADKSFGKSDPMELALAKVESGFELMDKLGIEYFCFHDRDIAPETDSLQETNQRLDVIADHISLFMEKYNKKCLWGTASLFTHPRYMNGAGSSSSADIFAYAAAQVKKAIELTVRFNGSGYVFWGGREGYETLLNTDMLFEQENIARLLRMSVDYGRSIGFKGDYYIEPKPKEPTKHQYDYDVAASIAFLQKYNLANDFKLNIEANHATLAGHTFQHEIRTAAINNMFGSIDANQGDLLLGWDTDQFPTNVYDSVLCMYEIIKAGGFTNGGLNFDARTRRSSYTVEDLFYSFIAGMDTFALGLIKADELIQDGRIDAFVKERYSSFKTGIGADIIAGRVGLKELEAYAYKQISPALPESGRQEYLESILNNVLFR
jgi:xylose isomerase